MTSEFVIFGPGGQPNYHLLALFSPCILHELNFTSTSAAFTSIHLVVVHDKAAQVLLALWGSITTRLQNTAQPLYQPVY